MTMGLLVAVMLTVAKFLGAARGLKSASQRLDSPVTPVGNLVPLANAQEQLPIDIVSNQSGKLAPRTQNARDSAWMENVNHRMKPSIVETIQAVQVGLPV